MPGVPEAGHPPSGVPALMTAKELAKLTGVAITPKLRFLLFGSRLFFRLGDDWAEAEE